jgi:hypothetical protein
MNSEEHEKLFQVVDHFQKSKVLLDSLGLNFHEAVDAFYQFNGNPVAFANYVISRRKEPRTLDAVDDLAESESIIVSLEEEFKKCVFALFIFKEFLCSAHLALDEGNEALLSQFQPIIISYILLLLLELQHADLEFSLVPEDGSEGWGQQSTLAARISKGVNYYGGYLKSGICYAVPGSGFLFQGVSAFSNLLRTRAQYDFSYGVERGWGPRELRAMTSPVPEGHVRVTCIRHGMGYHNDAMGAFSYLNRDAQLNEVGMFLSSFFLSFFLLFLLFFSSDVN